MVVEPAWIKITITAVVAKSGVCKECGKSSVIDLETGNSSHPTRKLGLKQTICGQNLKKHKKISFV